MIRQLTAIGAFRGSNDASDDVPKPTWGLLEIVVGVTAAVEFALLLRIGATVLGFYETPAIAAATWILTPFANHLFALTLAIWLVRRSGGSLASLGVRPLSSNHFYLPLIGFVGIVLILYGYAFIARLAGVESLSVRENVPPGALDYWFTAVLLTTRSLVITPIAEEITVRGFVFGGLRGIMPTPAAAVLSSVLFGFAHLRSGLLIPYTIIGILFAYVYTRTGSIYSVIAMHAIFNAISLGIALSQA